jgi:[ribosomal protein S18]-alanine N-acetyltransferase
MFVGATRNHTGKIRRRNEMALAADEFVIRQLEPEDSGAIADLESRCIGAAKWGGAAYRDIGPNGIIGWVATREDVVLGFILVRCVAAEMEILNLAVDPDMRRQGIAARLLAHAIQQVKGSEVKRVYLEVRESNSGARAFYSSKEFVEHGRRKNYYSQPVDDALLLVLRPH